MEPHSEGQPSRRRLGSRRAVSRSSKTGGKKVFRGLTCSNCRARKVRCEGSQPSCKTCEAYEDECRYDKVPPISQILDMSRRLQEAEKALQDMRTIGASPKVTEPGRSRDRDMPFSASISHSIHGDINESEINLTGHSAEAILSPGSNIALLSEDAPSEMSKEPMEPELTINEHGEICYYGPTSAVHEPSNVGSVISQATENNEYDAPMENSRHRLQAYNRESKIWEEFAMVNASMETRISQPIIAKLLRLHWTWVSPMFLWVYRPAFIRDMATGGRYYSQFLLIVICAHAAKYQDDNVTDILLARARQLLGDAIQRPSSIPTIQALLQWSARDLAHGSISRAWVYSGIAFRMATDLGLQYSGPDIKGMSVVDLEVRRRLFWSCYLWDKVISLYAGRLPAVTEVLYPDTLNLLDDSLDKDTWSPYYGGSRNSEHLIQREYQPMRSYSVSCFINSCKLGIIINDIIFQLYDRRNRNITEETIQRIKSRLDSWRAESPAHLRYDPDHLPALCPPTHLISQNLLYFTTIILAHRPFWSRPAYYRVCMNASQSIEKLVLLLESTFGLSNITYLMGYCIYTGASAILEDAKCARGTAKETLRTFLRALNAGMKSCPLLERSLQIIIRGLNRIPMHPAPIISEQPTRPVERPINAISGANIHIPAFPHFGPDLSMGFDQDAMANLQNFDSMAMLDCFPETQMGFEDLIYPSLS